jgi:Tol biopolymer transport system component
MTEFKVEVSCLDDKTLNDYLELRLSPDALQRMLRHLDECTQCAQLLKKAADRFRDPTPPLSRETQSQSPDASAGTPHAPALRGTVIGRYVVEHILGSGGMGVVYAAYDPELDRKVALKLIRATSPTGPGETSRERLLREAQAMAKVSHPNVVHVYDVGVWNEGVFVAMELVDGQTVRQWMERDGGDWQKALALFVAAGRGLAAAHAAGLVHRDFKPDNVLVGHDGRVRVTDFGLARPAGGILPSEPLTQSPSRLERRITHTGALMGTPAYMAPEQMSGGPSDARSDIFSFCVALFEALYGQRPFDATSLQALLAQIATGQLVSPPSSSRVPLGLRATLLRGLRAAPEERFATMEALLAELTSDPPQRRRATFRFVAVALTLVAATLTLAALRARRTPAWQPVIVDQQPVFEENADTPIFSPDGKWLVYASDRDSAFRLYRQPRDGSAPAVPITPPGWGVWVPKWSRDSRFIYFEDNIRLFRVPAEGGARELVADAVSYFAVCGDRLAMVRPFALDCADCQRLVVRQGDNERELTRVHGNLGRIACDRAGQRVVYSVVRDVHLGPMHRVGDLWLIALAGGPPQQLTFDGMSSYPLFHPDGKSIIYVSERSGRLNLWEQRLRLPRAATAERLTFGDGPDVAPDVSPDGREIIFDVDNGSMPLFAYSGAGVPRRKLTRALEDVDIVVPTRDGKELIVGVAKGTTPFIVSYPLPAGDERIITSGQAPALTPDERELVFARRDGAVTKILVIPRGGGPERLIATLPQKVRALSVGADGMVDISLGRALSELGVLAVPLAGGTPTRELESPWGLVLAHGDARLGVRFDPHGEVTVLRRGNQPWSEAQKLPFKYRDAIAWYPDGRAILYWTGAHIRRYELATGRDTQLIDAPSLVGLGLGASVDGATIYAVDTYSHVRRAIITNYGERPRPAE